MEVHDPPNQTRYVKQSRILAAGQTDFLSISPRPVCRNSTVPVGTPITGRPPDASERAGNVSLNQLLILPRRSPMFAAFPRSEYYQRVRLPPSLLSPSGWSIRLTYSTCYFQVRRRWISQVP
jgi:hypothetical protein